MSKFRKSVCIYHTIWPSVICFNRAGNLEITVTTSDSSLTARQVDPIFHQALVVSCWAMGLQISFTILSLVTEMFKI